MTGEPRRHRSKWDTREGPPDIVEISEDESPQKGGSKPDGSMHRGNGGHEKEHRDGVNKDMKDVQSKASSERSWPSKLADEDDDKGWGKADLEKPLGNQGTNRYADDRRRGDGWGAALDRGYSSRMSSDPDPWRQRSLSPSHRGVWNRPRRNRSRSRSRSRSRNRSRSRSRSRGRGRDRSRSPYFVDRGPEWRIERGRTSGGPLPCRDFVAGRCRRGLNCRFPHEDGGHRPFEEHHPPAGPRERYGYQSKEFMDSREQSDFLQSRQPRSRYDDETWERSEPRRDYRSTEQCYNFIKGRCSRGASCWFAHDDSAPHGGWRDETRQGAYDRVGPESSYGNRVEHRRANKTPCKFFASGLCRRGTNCPYLHEEAPQSQMGLNAHDEPSNYNDRPTGRGNLSKWGEQNNGTHTTTQNAARDRWENPVSQSIGRNGSHYEYENRHPKDVGKSRYQITPQEDFGSQVHKTEVTASQLLTPVQTTADSMNNNEKVSGIDQNAPRTAANLSMHTGMYGGNAAENLGPILQSQDTISQIHAPPTLPVPTHLQNSTSSLPSNIHMQQSNFSVHPQDQFLATHAAANNSVHNNVQGQPVAPHMGNTQPGYGLEPQALHNLSAHNGHDFSVAGQVPQDLSSSVHIGHSQAAIDLHRLQGQDMGGGAQAPSTQNMQNFQPIAPNVQIQNQSLQGLSHVPASSSVDTVGAPVSHDASKNEDIHRVTASLAQYFGNGGLSASTVGLQPSEPNASSNLMVTSSAAPSAVQPNPWPWAQQHPGMVQPAAVSIPAEQHQQAPQAFQTPMAVGTGNGNSVLVPPSVASTAQAAASVVNETMPSVNKKVETKDTDAEANEDGENKKGKESKALKMFKIALADFVKEALKPTWKEGQLSREVHKTIVKKVVDKVTSTVENTPPTKEKIDMYMSFSKDKLNKLVQAYVGKYATKA